MQQRISDIIPIRGVSEVVLPPPFVDYVWMDILKGNTPFGIRLTPNDWFLAQVIWLREFCDEGVVTHGLVSSFEELVTGRVVRGNTGKNPYLFDNRIDALGSVLRWTGEPVITLSIVDNILLSTPQAWLRYTINPAHRGWMEDNFPTQIIF